MSYFKNLQSYEDLKTQYRALAMANHPDMGGNLEAMQTINSEYDKLFPIWKHRSVIKNTETAESTRNEFYTAHGWKGERYNCNISVKEIACIMREYVKDIYNDYRFSVRSDYNHIYITMTEAPEEIFIDENLKNKGHIQLNNYHLDRNDAITEKAKKIMIDINKLLQSYNFDDSDSMIDYFHTNFYTSLNIGAWDQPLKIVSRNKKAAKYVEYEIVEVTKTKTHKTLEPRNIEQPEEIKAGQYFKLLGGFNYGCFKGSVYQIIGVNNNDFITAHKMGKGYKNVTSGNVRGTNFPCTVERLKNWIKQGAISFVELVEVEKTEEYTSSIRRPKKSTGMSTKIREETTEQNNSEPAASASQNDINNYDFEIVTDIDTRDNSKIFVVKVKNKVEDFATLRELMKGINGYYSRYKHGFIFKDDPTEAINRAFNSENVEPRTEETTAEELQYIADCLEDESAKIIIKLGLNPGEYLTSMEYKNQLTAYIEQNKKQLTAAAIAKIDIVELREMVAGILATTTTKKQSKTDNKTDMKTITQKKIAKQIDSLTAKIKALSGDYLTNTYKRMNEQASRDQKKEGFSFDIDLLTYLYNVLEQRNLTLLEENLLISAFRDSLHSYYKRHINWTETPEEKRFTSWTQVKYPEIDKNCPVDGWFNLEVPKRQKRLNKAGIYNTEQLIKSIVEYGEIVKEAIKPIDRTAQEIKRRENECKLQQKGDIQFTPSEVAAQLVELAGIDENSRVLEPSAGIGNIVDKIKEVTKNIDVIERMSNFRELLRLKGYSLVGDDFLEYRTEKLYDSIIMNPPFSKNQDIEHLKHAFSMLKNGGTLVCVTSPHWSFAGDKQSIDFRNWLDEQDYYTEDLKAKTFEMTGVTSKILVINKKVEQRENIA